MEWVTGQNSYGLRAGLEAVKRLLSSPQKKAHLPLPFGQFKQTNPKWQHHQCQLPADKIFHLGRLCVCTSVRESQSASHI